MCKLGLKLWSDNEAYADEIIRLRKVACFEYIELYSMPDTYTKHSDFWAQIGGHFVIHAPHFGHGVNLSKRSEEARNRKLIDEARFFADKLKATMIIVHPGVGGEFDETARQLLNFDDTRIVIENKPYFGFTKDQICVGSQPAEMKEMLNATRLRFCLDFGHAIYAANALSVDPIEHLRSFLKLRPVIFHFTDGDWNAVHDVHTRYGKGTFPLTDLLALIPDRSMVTNEAKKLSPSELSDFEEDSYSFRNLFQKQSNKKTLVSVRQATMDDARALYDLSMDPQVRVSSLNSDRFTYQSHIEWLEVNISNPSRRVYICEVAGVFIGQVRYSIQLDVATISISIVESWRGTGIAQRLFGYSLDMLTMSIPSVDRVVAIVNADNWPSNNFFQKLGFKACKGSSLITSESSIEYNLGLR